MSIKFFSISLTIVFFQILAVQAQELNFKQLDYVKVPSLDSLSHIKELKAALKSKRIVLLGEQTHGEGSTFDAKVELIKFLHQEFGFDIVAFESGFYSNYKAGKINQETEPEPNVYFESVFDIWSDSKQFEKLVNYTKETQHTDHPLCIMGFDFQEDHLFEEYFFDDLIKVFNQHNIHLPDSTLTILKETFFGGVDYISANYQDSLSFYAAVQAIEAGFKKIASTDHNQTLHQSFMSYLALIEWGVRMFKEQEYKVQNPRDLQMAKNLIFLANLYPEKKIIGWGASYHFANQVQKYQITELTSKYMQQMQKEGEKENLDSLLDGAVPMGKILKEYFKDELYSMAFSSWEGTFGWIGSDPDTLLNPPPGSIEYALAKKEFDFAFVNYPDIMEGNFYSSPLGNLPIFAPWQDIFDGLFFVRSAYPPEFSNYSAIDVNGTKTKPSINIKGKIVDAKTNQPVVYAHVALLNSPGGTVSNDQGIFSINISETESIKHLAITSVGYKKQEVAIKDYADSLDVKLISEVSVLNEIIISDKSLSAKQILKKARQSIGANYYQNPYNQELFYRVRNKENDSIVFNEEAAVLLFDKSGYQPSNNASKNLYGQILQFRNTTGNPGKRKWNGVGSLWLVYTHDLILDKDNVLHRTSAYDLEIANMLPYEDKTVYEIKFVNKRPSAYNTGYGYPAPKASHGRLYIDSESYAILRYEHCIERKDSKIKKGSEFQSVKNRIQLIQTYRKFDDRYFLTLSKQIMSGTRINIASKDSTQYHQIFDLVATDIVVDSLNELEKPVSKIKVGMKIKKDEEFWQKHNYVIEDKYNDLNVCEK